MNIYIYKKNRINKILSYFSYFLWKKNSRYITPRRIRNLYDTFLSYWSYFNSKKSTISVSHIALDFLHVVFFPRNTIGIVCKKTISDSAAVAFRHSRKAPERLVTVIVVVVPLLRIFAICGPEN